LLHQSIRLYSRDIGTFERDLTVANAPVFEAKQIRRGLKRRCLASAVRPKQSNDFSLWHLK
jgi:hypothetical protein